MTHVLYWIIRVWSLAAGTAIMPRVIIILAIRRMRDPHRLFRLAAFDHLCRAIETAGFVVALMTLEDHPGTFRMHGVVGYAVAGWMLLRLGTTYSAWRMMLQLVGFQHQQEVEEAK